LTPASKAQSNRDINVKSGARAKKSCIFWSFGAFGGNLKIQVFPL